MWGHVQASGFSSTTWNLKKRNRESFHCKEQKGPQALQYTNHYSEIPSLQPPQFLPALMQENPFRQSDTLLLHFSARRLKFLLLFGLFIHSFIFLKACISSHPDPLDHVDFIFVFLKKSFLVCLCLLVGIRGVRQSGSESPVLFRWALAKPARMHKASLRGCTAVLSSWRNLMDRIQWCLSVLKQAWCPNDLGWR